MNETVQAGRPSGTSTSGWGAGRSGTGGCASGSRAATSGTSSSRRAGLAAARRPRQRGRLPHRLRRRLHRDVVPLLRPRDAPVVDLLGGQPAARAARPARGRLVRRATPASSRATTFRGQADPRPLHVVARRHADAALGAGVLGRRRRDLGDELDQRLHARRSTSVTAVERTAVDSGLPASAEAGAPGGERHARRGRAQVVRRRAGRDPVPGTSPRAGAATLRGAARLGEHRAGRRPRLRDPASLRRGLLLPARLDVAERQRALGDGLGQDDEADTGFRPWPGRGAPADLLRLGAGRRLARAAGVGRFLRSERDADARRTYLGDTFEGPV